MRKKQPSLGCCSCCLICGALLLVFCGGMVCCVPCSVIYLVAGAAKPITDTINTVVQGISIPVSNVLPTGTCLKSHSTPSPDPTAHCLPAGNSHATAVVDAALSLAPHLHGQPDVSYDEHLPQAALSYWQRVCPLDSGCWSYWQSGNLQCVELVTATYAMANDPLPAAPNAVDFWTVYAHRPGWQEIPAQSGLPAPGDIIVWSDEPAVGHVAIVVAVQAPQGSQPGVLAFVQANGPRPLDHQPILPDGTIATWPGFTVLGYLRHVS